MAQLSGGTTVAIRMDQINLANLIDGDPFEQSPTTLALDKGSGVTVTWRGIAFVYGGPTEEFGYVDKLIRGTLFQIAQTTGSDTLLLVDRLTTMLTKQFSQDVRAPDSTTALGYIFSSDDDMRGTSFADNLNGYGGHDNLFGGDGADTLLGGAGNDHLYGQSANGGSDGNDSLSAGDGTDYLQGNAGNDTLDGGAAADRIQGGQGNDNLLGVAGNDTLNGNLGNDTLDGGDGNDSLRGGQGNDSLTAGAGNDTLAGDLGADTLRGGTGSDVFVFTGAGAGFDATATAPLTDVISDFGTGDRIDLSFAVTEVLTGARQTTFARAVTEAENQFIAHAGSGKLAAVGVGSDSYIFFAADGGSTIDSVVRMTGVSVTTIDTTDFI